MRDARWTFVSSKKRRKSRPQITRTNIAIHRRLLWYVSGIGGWRECTHGQTTICAWFLLFLATSQRFYERGDKRPGSCGLRRCLGSESATYVVAHLQLAARVAIAGRGRNDSGGDSWGAFLGTNYTAWTKFSVQRYCRSSTILEGNYHRVHMFVLPLGLCRFVWFLCFEAPKALGLRSMSGNDPTHVHFQTSVVRTWGADSV